MKTSNIEVHDMLSVWSVEEVEDRIGKVPGVESVTVNYAAKSATVRYDETQLEVNDIKSGVRQGGYESGASVPNSAGKGHEGHTAPVAPPATPAPATPKTPPDAPAPAGAAQDKTAPSTTPKPSPATPAAGNAGDKQPNKVMPDKS
ncbi:MAG: heavy-metal-associated domain-containing protein [Candidatus Omnitrophota bacterium]|nr:heavy-metal-associated domain-containing protein [Candidatus Omnitrophota bacterium]